MVGEVEDPRHGAETQVRELKRMRGEKGPLRKALVTRLGWVPSPLGRSQSARFYSEAAYSPSWFCHSQPLWDWIGYCSGRLFSLSQVLIIQCICDITSLNTIYVKHLVHGRCSALISSLIHPGRKPVWGNSYACISDFSQNQFMIRAQKNQSQSHTCLLSKVLFPCWITLLFARLGNE